MPKVRDRPLSARAQLAMTPFAQMKANHFLRALLDPEPVDSRKVWRLAADFGISRTTLYKVARANGVRFLPRGRRKAWARPDYAGPRCPPPPWYQLREALQEALGVLAACFWDLWRIVGRVLRLFVHLVRREP